MCLSVLRRQKQFVYWSLCFLTICLSVCLSVCLSAVRAYSSTTDVDAWVRVFIDKSSQSINWQEAINTEAQCLTKSSYYIDRSFINQSNQNHQYWCSGTDAAAAAAADDDDNISVTLFVKRIFVLMASGLLSFSQYFRIPVHKCIHIIRPPDRHVGKA